MEWKPIIEIIQNIMQAHRKEISSTSLEYCKSIDGGKDCIGLKIASMMYIPHLINNLFQCI